MNVGDQPSQPDLFAAFVELGEDLLAAARLLHELLVTPSPSRMGEDLKRIRSLEEASNATIRDVTGNLGLEGGLQTAIRSSSHAPAPTSRRCHGLVGGSRRFREPLHGRPAHRPGGEASVFSGAGGRGVARLHNGVERPYGYKLPRAGGARGSRMKPMNSTGRRWERWLSSGAIHSRPSAGRISTTGSRRRSTAAKRPLSFLGARIPRGRISRCIVSARIAEK